MTDTDATREAQARATAEMRVRELVASQKEKQALLADESFMRLLELVEPLKPGTVALMLRDVNAEIGRLNAALASRGEPAAQPEEVMPVTDERTNLAKKIISGTDAAEQPVTPEESRGCIASGAASTSPLAAPDEAAARTARREGLIRSPGYGTGVATASCGQDDPNS